MKNFVFFVLFSFIISSPIYSQQLDDLQEKLLNNDRLKLFPGSPDGKNYFFLQSIGDKTKIVIGDFTQLERKIIMINLEKDYTTIKSVVEYNLEKKSIKEKKVSDSKFFTTDIVKLKRDIITGAVYKGNSTDLMKSYPDLETIFEEGESSRILSEVYGFSVKLTDVDEINRVVAMFTFGNTFKGYYLQFKTFYYVENAQTERIPGLKYSVYCKNTHDPIVQEYVEKLFKIKKPVGKVDK